MPRSARPASLRRALFGALVVAASAVAAGEPPAASPTAGAASQTSKPTTTPADSSYHLGLVLGGQIDHAGLSHDVVVDELIRGIRDGMAAKLPTPAERDDAVRFMRAGRDALAERNRTAAAEFLAKNQKAQGVTTTASGLEYRVLAVGDEHASPPGPRDTVTIQYRASLADGTEFDNSYAHGQPATFRMNAMIKGWNEALSLMRPGARWRVWVPPALGYDAMSPPPIPPGALLVYELELLKVERGAAPASPPAAGSSRAPAAKATGDLRAPASPPR
jgi:FKBP-type peptidyl-prolyl cis-trans isomerase